MNQTNPLTCERQSDSAAPGGRAIAQHWLTPSGRCFTSLAPEVESVDPTVFLPSTIEEVRPLSEIRNAYAQHALALYRGNVHATARALKITDRTLPARLDE